MMRSQVLGTFCRVGPSKGQDARSPAPQILRNCRGVVGLHHLHVLAARCVGCYPPSP